MVEGRDGWYKRVPAAYTRPRQTKDFTQAASLLHSRGPGISQPLKKIIIQSFFGWRNKHYCNKRQHFSQGLWSFDSMHVKNCGLLGPGGCSGPLTTWQRYLICSHGTYYSKATVKHIITTFLSLKMNQLKNIYNFFFLKIIQLKFKPASKIG